MDSNPDPNSSFIWQLAVPLLELNLLCEELEIIQGGVVSGWLIFSKISYYI